MHFPKIFLFTTLCMLIGIQLHAQTEQDSFRFIINDKPANTGKGIDVGKEMALWRKVDSNSPYPEKLIMTGHALEEQRAFKEALHIYEKALFYTKTFDIAHLPSLYFNIAHAYNGNNEYIYAMRYYAKALSHLKTNNDKKSAILAAKIHTNMAGILVMVPNYEKANFYLDKALPVFEEYKDTVNIVVNLFQRALIYKQEKQDDSALALYSRLLDITDRTIQSKKASHNRQHSAILRITLQHKAMIIWNIVDLYGHKNAPDAALKVLDKIKNDMPRLTAYQQAVTMHAYANTYALKGHYNLAESYLLKTLQIFEKDNSRIWIKSIYKDLGKLYALKKDYKNAWHYNKLYADMEIENLRASLKELNYMYDLEANYQLSQQENELIRKQLLIAEQEKHILKKNILIAVILSGSALLLLIAFFLFRNYRRKQRLLSQEKEIEHLKAMMKGEENERSRLARELHDGIGGMLAAIKMNAGAIKVEHPETAHIDRLNMVINMLQDTSAEVRTTALNLMPDTLTKYGLQEALSHYISKMNASHDIVIGLHIPDTLTQLDKPTELIIYRIVQELLQNVIKHAAASNAEVQIIEHNNDISITVKITA